MWTWYASIAQKNCVFRTLGRKSQPIASGGGDHVQLAGQYLLR